MNYLRTKRDDKETFEILVWILGIASVCAFAAELDLFSNIRAKGLLINIIAFLTTEVPSWIWNATSTAVTVAFLVMLRNGLPEKGKPVAMIVSTAILLECSGCISDILSGLFPEYQYIQTITLILVLMESLVFIILGYKLRKNYQGKIKTLGTIFIVISIISILLFLILSGLGSAGTKEDESYYHNNYDDADKLWQVIVSLFLIVVASFLQIFPWWYESKLLIEGTKYLGDEDDIIEREESKQEPTKAALSSPIENKKNQGRKYNTPFVWVGIGTIVILLILGIIAWNIGDDESSEKATISIPSDREVISGDFDGDGEIDHLWIDGEFDDEDFATTQLTLCSDNPNLDELNWNAPCGVMLFNLGKLDDSDKDFLGCIPFAMSDWAQYEVYKLNKESWEEAIEPFSVYLENELAGRVTKSKIPGFVTIYENDPSSDNMFSPSRREVRLNNN